MSNFIKYIEDTKNDIVLSLENSSKAYYQTGMGLFHELRFKTYLEYQPAVGNLCIAIELLLKAIIAQKAFRYLYANIPLEVQIMLTNPEVIENDFNPRKFSIELKSFQKYNTIELNSAISLFYHFFPPKRQEFKPYFSLLSAIRNASVHTALPPFQRYDLDRIAYLATKLFQFTEEEKLIPYFHIFSDEKTQKFINNYNSKRIDRVRKAIENAQNNSKKIKHFGRMIISLDEWDYMVISCPICSSDAIISGYTEDNAGYEDDPDLSFYADSIECNECGLELFDSQELELAGIETYYDRNDDIDKLYS